jgi:hypothetical protein
MTELSRELLAHPRRTAAEMQGINLWAACLDLYENPEVASRVYCIQKGWGDDEIHMYRITVQRG